MTIPNPPLDEKTFDEIFFEARKKLSVYSTQWTNYNEADPGITLLELFSWLSDNLTYTLSRLTKKNRLKFLKLLGIRPKGPIPTKINACFVHTNEISKVPRNSRLVSDFSDLIFETEDEINVVPAEIKQVLTKSRSGLKDETKTLDNGFLGFGPRPSLGNAFLLGVDTRHDATEIFKIFIDIKQEKEDNFPFGRHCEDNYLRVSSQLDWEYLTVDENKKQKEVKLQVIQDNTNSLTRSGIVSLVIPFSDAKKMDLLNSGKKLSWIVCKLVGGQYEMPPNISSITLNAVPARQGCTTFESIWTSNGLPGQRLEVSNKPLIKVIQVKVQKASDELLWKEVEDFDSSGPDDVHYIVDTLNGVIQFGDGMCGDIPNSGSKVTVTYIYGSTDKQIDTSKLQLRLDDENLYPLTVRSSLISQGVGAEEIDETISRLNEELRVPFKAVSQRDYEYIAKNTPGLRVARASVVPDSKSNSVTVVVIPYSSMKIPSPSKEFLETVYSHLDKHRLITTSVRVVGPNYVQISIWSDITINNYANPSEVKKQIIEALNSFLEPISEGGGWKLGRPVYRSEVYAVIKKIEGVEYITSPYIQASGNAGTFTYQRGLIWIDSNSLVYPGQHLINIVSSKQRKNLNGDKDVK